MKIPLLAMLILSSSVSWAGSRPVACNITQANGLQKTYKCTERPAGSKANLNSFCIFDKGWKYGKLRPNAALKKDRFIPQFPCTGSLETLQMDETTKVHGPRLYDETETSRTKEGRIWYVKSKTPKEKASAFQSSYPEKVPYTCFRDHHPTSKISSRNVSCGSSDDGANLCYLSYLTGERIGTLEYYGPFWIQVPNPEKDAIAVCNGGVSLGEPVKGDRQRKLIPAVYDVDETLNEEVMYCHYRIPPLPGKEPAKNLTKRSCRSSPKCNVSFTLSTNPISNRTTTGCCAQLDQPTGPGIWAVQTMRISKAESQEDTGVKDSKGKPIFRIYDAQEMASKYPDRFTACEEIVVYKTVE